MTLLILALVGVLAAPLPAARIAPVVATGQSTTTSEIHALFQSINAAWTRSLAARGRTYAAPRLLTLRHPGGHPAHGAGYSPGAVIVDLSDVDAVERVFGARSRSLTALLIAHEVGHHVQYRQLRSEGGRASDLTAASELQADCYAGWWLGTPEAANWLGVGLPSVSVDLDRDFPRLIYLLSMAQAGRLTAETDAALHGSPTERVRAIRIGQSLADPSACERAPSQIQAPR